MRINRWVIVVVACITLVLLLAAFKVLQIRQLIAFAESFPEPSATVEVDTVTASLWTDRVRTTANVIAPQQLQLRNERAGTITVVGFVPGATVKKGQVLLRLDSSEEQAQLQGAEAEMHLADLARNRYQKLIDKGASSRDQVDQANAQYAVAEARAQALRAVIDKKTLRAPFDARTDLHEWQVGQYLAADTVVVQLTGLSPDVWVDFHLPQHYVSLPVGHAVMVSSDENNTQVLQGETIASDGAVDTQSRNLRFRALLRDAASVLKPGMLVNVSIEVNEAATVLTVPVAALHHDTEGTYVYTLRADNQQWRAEKRRVLTGTEYEQRVIVSSGLQAGEKVAAKGSYKLMENMLVNVAAPVLTTKKP